MSKIDASSIDPLLECLVFLTSHFGRAKSAPALTAGLAYGEKNMGPELFCEAAEKINLNVRVVKRKKPVKIPAPVLPSVLILEKDQACVLLGVSKDRKKAHIWSPETRALRDVSMADRSGKVL